MSNHENLMIDYGEENMSFFFVNYKKKPIGRFNMSKKVLKRVFWCGQVCRTHFVTS